MKNIFPKIKGRLLFNEPLFRHTTFRIGGPCRVWAEPRNEDELKKILKFTGRGGRGLFVIGMGSNILFKEEGFNGTLVHLGADFFKKVKFAGTRVTVGAGLSLGHLINLACSEGLLGIEGLVGIPGTLGGAIFMNSGYRGNISDVLEEVRVMDRATGKVGAVKRKDLKFGYRDSGDLCNYIILGATLRLKKHKKEALRRRKNKFLKIKKEEQPLGHFSAGCIFKNPGSKFSAARYIEMSRLKGKRIGDAMVSERHANFIVNLKEAKERDVSRLISFVRKRVKSQFDIDLTPEITIV